MSSNLSFRRGARVRCQLTRVAWKAKPLPASVFSWGHLKCVKTTQAIRSHMCKLFAEQLWCFLFANFFDLNATIDWHEQKGQMWLWRRLQRFKSKERKVRGQSKLEVPMTFKPTIFQIQDSEWSHIIIYIPIWKNLNLFFTLTWHIFQQIYRRPSCLISALRSLAKDPNQNVQAACVACLYCSAAEAQELLALCLEPMPVFWGQGGGGWRVEDGPREKGHFRNISSWFECYSKLVIFKWSCFHLKMAATGENATAWLF